MEQTACYNGGKNDGMDLDGSIEDAVVNNEGKKTDQNK